VGGRCYLGVLEDMAHGVETSLMTSWNVPGWVEMLLAISSTYLCVWQQASREAQRDCAHEQRRVPTQPAATIIGRKYLQRFVNYESTLNVLMPCFLVSERIAIRPACQLRC
jgi:hypothetical protein